MTVNLREIMTGRTYPEAGAVVYGILVSDIDNGDGIVLDATGVVSIPSMFLNMSIGKFIEDFGYERLKGKVSFSGLTKSEAERLKRYMMTKVQR